MTREINKKMSQSMVRSQKSEATSDYKGSQRDHSQEKSSPLILKKHKALKNRFGKTKIASRIEDQNSLQSISKSGIQGIITPVVQISYNQIKSEKEAACAWTNRPEKTNKPLNSQRGVRLDLIQTSAGKGDRTESEKRQNKGSFMSSNDATLSKAPKLISIKPDFDCSSVKPHLNPDDHPDDGVDECMPGESTLTNRANSVNESFQYNKR